MKMIAQKSIRTAILMAGFAGLLTITSTHGSARADDCPTGDQMAKSGTIAGWGKSVGWIVGARWGEGTLALNDGTEHKFTFNGAKLLESGVARADFTGNVYNLSSFEQFAGDYAAVSQGITLVEGITGAAVLKNENCVYIEVSVESEGVRLSAPAPGGVLVKLEEHQ